MQPLRQGAPSISVETLHPPTLAFLFFLKHSTLKINLNYAAKNATASLTGWNHFHMQKCSFILPKIHGEAAKQKPPPVSISHSSLAAPRRQPSRRTRMERAGGKKRDFHHLPTRSPTPLREKFPASSHLPPPSFHHSHFILLQKLWGEKKRTGGCSSDEEKRRRKEDRQLRHGGMRGCFCLLSGSEQLQSARWGSSLYSSHPSLPFPACLQHMSPPIVAMATPPHVADRMRKKRGRGGDNNAEGKGRVGEEEMEEKKKSRNRGGRKRPRVKEENKAQNKI